MGMLMFEISRCVQTIQYKTKQNKKKTKKQKKHVRSQLLGRIATKFIYQCGTRMVHRARPTQSTGERAEYTFGVLWFQINAPLARLFVC